MNSVWTDDQTFADDIEGYPATQSVAAGEVVDLHVSTRSDTWSLTVERWGAERQVVYEAGGLPGSFYEVPADADSNGCGWPVGHQIEVGDDWRSGFYLVTLRADQAELDKAVAHAFFVVRGTGASLLYVLPTNTWNAYNTWGGTVSYTHLTLPTIYSV